MTEAATAAAICSVLLSDSMREVVVAEYIMPDTDPLSLDNMVPDAGVCPLSAGTVIPHADTKGDFSESVVPGGGTNGFVLESMISNAETDDDTSSDSLLTDTETDLAVAALNLSAAMTCLAAALEIHLAANPRKPQRKRRKPKKPLYMVRPKVYQPRQEYQLPAELESYRWLLGMNDDHFKTILGYIEDDIYKMNTLMRQAIPVEAKLGIALRYLASGSDIIQLGKTVNVSSSYCRNSVFEVCDAIYKNMKDEYLKFPDTTEAWLNIAEEFKRQWQFPNCLGALGVYHAKLEPLVRKTVMLVVVDASAKFTYVGLICRPKYSNEEIFKSSALYAYLTEGKKNFPEPSLVDDHRILPYVFVGDETLPLMNNLLTPYPKYGMDSLKSNFNAKLNVPLRNVEKAVGILEERFKILRTIKNFKEEPAKKLIMSCCILHNYLMTNCEIYRENSKYHPLQVYHATELAKNMNNPMEPLIIRQSYAEHLSAANPLLYGASLFDFLYQT